MQDFDYTKVDAGYYDQILHDKKNKMRSFWHKYEFAEIADCITSDPNARILDVGCAAGSFLGTLKKDYREAIGADIAPAQVNFANKKYANGNRRFVIGDIRELNYEKSSFDFIVIGEVVEHLTYGDSLDVLRHLHGLLKPSGRLIMTTPNYHSIWPVLEWIVNRLSPVSYEHQHINKLTPTKSVKLMKKAGLKIEKTHSFFIVSQFLAFISRPLARWFCKLETKVFPRLGSLIIVSSKK